MTLSSGYLEELSIRYKKQIEDLQLSVRQSGEALSAANKVRQQEQTHVQNLNQQLENLSNTVERMSIKIQSVTLVSHHTANAEMAAMGVI